MIRAADCNYRGARVWDLAGGRELWCEAGSGWVICSDEGEDPRALSRDEARAYLLADADGWLELGCGKCGSRIKVRAADVQIGVHPWGPEHGLIAFVGDPLGCPYHGSAQYWLSPGEPTP
jgi:hypothetical protein